MSGDRTCETSNKVRISDLTEGGTPVEAENM